MAMTVHREGGGVVGDTWDVQAVGAAWGGRDRECRNWVGRWRGNEYRSWSWDSGWDWGGHRGSRELCINKGLEI